MSTVYALLVGIDTYQPPVRPLYGCVADIEAMAAFLRDRIPQENRSVKVLKNEQATRQAIIDSFLNHLCQAGKDDVALFCYSGHGSTAPTAPEFWHLEPDRLDETLVCYDSRTPGKYDLADKEIAKLIAEVAKKEPHTVVVLDSCHSGSATRNLETIGVRRVPADDRQRPVESYLVKPEEVDALGQTRSVTEAKSGWLRLPKGKHVVLSACQSDEEAKEIRIGDRMRGVFSHFLQETLQNTTSLWTYRDLFARVNALVRAKVARQSPLIEATDFEDLDRPFLGGAVRPHDPYFIASFDNTAGWIIDGGAIHGIPSVQRDETTHLALFPAEATDLNDLNKAIGEVRVTEQQPASSKVAITLNDRQQPDKDKTYKAVVTALPVAAVGVSMEGDEHAIKLVREALDQASPTGGRSLLVHEVREGPELGLIARDNRYEMIRVGDDRPLFAFIEGWSADNAREAVEYLEHMARWMHMANLSNPASKLPPNAVRMDIYLVAANGKESLVDLAAQGSELKLFYEYRDGEWHEPQFKLKLTNTSSQRLYCMLFDLTDRFKIWAEDLLPGAWLDAKGGETWAFNRDPIPATVPDELWKQRMTEFKDLLKLVASTEECDASRFQQDNLDVKYRTRSTRGLAALNTLERLMQRAHTRDIGSRPAAHDKLADWTTAELSVTTVRPLEGAAVPAKDRSVTLAPQVTVLGHAALKGNARLTTAPLATRDMTGAPSLPAWLRDDPSHVQPFELSPSRSVEASLNVLELTEVSNREAVTPEQPLLVRVDAPLAPNEHVLPIAYDPDSELFLPLGRAKRTGGGIEIEIQRLPEPSASSRSLLGSIKIFFEKVFTEKLCAEFRYPLLGTIDASGNSTTDPDEVRKRVTKAKRILLYVHGIIGDTKQMAASALTPAPALQPPLPALGQRYDLVLTFDYENINTSIEENARTLKKRLEQAGLGAGHGKMLHIIAHSMGGLISRWFIEREGGNAIAQHLVMLGTPNAGSPWPTIQDWATAAIGLGLNALTAVVWPAKVLGGLVAAIEKIDVALDQMAPNSEFLKSLAASADPKTPYTVLAGNTSIISAAMQPEPGKTKSRIARLFEKLSLQRVLHVTTSLAFFGNPNDVAVSVESISSLPRDRSPQPIVQPVACDHMTYFATEAGLRALYKALA